MILVNDFKKAITFSFDDGITQDRRLIEILDKYNLKCTFNLNSGLFGTARGLDFWGKTVAHVIPRADEIKEIYQNHEVAAHTLTHPMLPEQDEAEIIRQVEEDRRALSEIVGYEVSGMAYPCGGENNDDRVAEIIRKNTGIKYARTIKSTYAFDIGENLLRFNPTVHIMEKQQSLELAQKFLELETDKFQLFYVWGHSFEFDLGGGWEYFEEFCKKLSGKSDIFYGTNSEVFELIK